MVVDFGMDNRVERDRRGGRRPRRFTDAAVYVTGGRWGPRRLHVSQCLATLRAEDVYDDLMRQGKAGVGPGWRGTPEIRSASGAVWTVAVEIRANPIWRIGRLFFRCSGCDRLATRLYVPVERLDPRCRRCWGLNYRSQSENYKATGYLGRLFGALALATTAENRQARRRASRLRQAERRRFLNRSGR